MSTKLCASDLVPAGFSAERITRVGDETCILLSRTDATAACPACGRMSRTVRSRYCRQVADLPLSGRRVRLLVRTRRFACDAVLCGKQIFAERFGDVLPPYARRTGRLEHVVHHLALALGGRPAARFAQRLMLPVSNDTLLRVIRRQGLPPSAPPSVIGIDDWAWRRNHRYGTIVCDLERRRPVSLLPEAWLRQNPQIQIVARDRGGAYGLAAARALPDAVQVADRWHLMENASRAFLDAVRKSMRQIRKTLGATRVDPKLLTAAERLQYEGYLRREQTNAAIMALSKDSMTIKEIVRLTGHSRGLVRQVLRGQRNDVFRSRESSLEMYLEWLDAQWAAGRRNGTELWRRLRTQGFRGSRRVVSEWATRRKRADKADADTLTRTFSARTIARLLTTNRDNLTKSETVTIAAIESGVPLLIAARDIITDFHVMVRRKMESQLMPWIDRARDSLVASFGNGVVKDIKAVRAAIASPWSNGQTEGQITKLKLVKRQMYGRGKLDLLQARLIGAT
ncbi:ISL3 family transposase [Rhizobium lentis]|uniref:ISL3 family transposase n=1 Tax=Rhizobium lentis TaxID=1138194 RepID=UPI001C82C60E|nr:ISL3 family transposase [Rhizobium lentis]MBX5000913.1 ISL3 family transposase [Rhizobium lentis]MBX5020674.1 ISL3 family transposase [Rhizobium lentis]